MFFQALQNYLAGKFVQLCLLPKLNRAAMDPCSAQEKTLKYILSKNAETDFGRKHSFSDIRSIDDFKQRFPIQNYEDLRPFIEKQMSTGAKSIVFEKPFLYLQTSGTTGQPKYIPAIGETIRAYQCAQKIFAHAQAAAAPGIFSGKILAVVSPAIEGYLDNGTPYGSMSGVVYQNMPAIISARYVLPAEVFEIEDYDTKYLLITALATYEKNITAVATANPSTLIKMSEVLKTNAEKICTFIRTGDIEALGLQLPKHLKDKITKNHPANILRAEEIEKALKSDKGIDFSFLWPRLKGIITWTKGNGATLIPRLRKVIPEDTKVIEMGYLASEFRGTITIDCDKNLGLPTLTDLFFEFVEKSDWDNGSRDTLTLDRIEQGKQYYIIVTALHGLYRYFINDIIEVTGRYLNTPTIDFVQKGRGVTNLTGEKVYEEQVVTALQKTSRELNLPVRFFSMIVDKELFSYTLYVETLDSFDQETFKTIFNAQLADVNLEYAAKVKSGRLQPAKIKRISAGTQEEYRKHCISAGQRESQIKFLHLQYMQDMAFSFEDFTQA